MTEGKKTIITPQKILITASLLLRSDAGDSGLFFAYFSEPAFDQDIGKNHDSQGRAGWLWLLVTT